MPTSVIVALMLWEYTTDFFIGFKTCSMNETERMHVSVNETKIQR